MIIIVLMIQILILIHILLLIIVLVLMIMIMIMIGSTAWTTTRRRFCPSTASAPRRSALGRTRRGTTGVSTNGVTANNMFLTGFFWVLPLIYFCLPKSARAYPFEHSVGIHYFCSGPISVDPICLRPNYDYDHDYDY